jgi:ketosteroid isomerase-like protein
MKHYIIMVLLLSSAIIAAAQSKSEKQVEQAVQQLRKAMVDADSVTLDKLTSPQLSYGHSSGVIESKQEFISKIASGKSDFVTIDLSEQVVTVDKKTAMVRHTLIAATNDGGRPGTVKLHVLTVWQKKGSQWKLLARQAVRIT